MHRRSFLQLAVLAGTSTVWPNRLVSEDFVSEELKHVDKKALLLRTLTKGRAELWKYQGLAFIKDGPIAYTPAIKDIELIEIGEGYFEKIIFKFDGIEIRSAFTVSKLGVMDEHKRIVGIQPVDKLMCPFMLPGDTLYIRYTLSI